MSYVKTLVFLLLCSFLSSQAQAEWRAIFERAGFFGRYAAGVSYEFNPEHAVDLSLGMYTIDDDDFYQTNFAYRYSRWQVPFYGNNWRPLQFGVFAIYAMNQDRYFITSPSKYPYPKYYDETALRYGAEFSSTLTMLPSNIAIAYRLRIFDTGLIAAFNNSNRDLQYYISSGLSLQYAF